MLAMYVALLFGLERPYWAMTAIYIVANPISGATDRLQGLRPYAWYDPGGCRVGGAGGYILQCT